MISINAGWDINTGWGCTDGAALGEESGGAGGQELDLLWLPMPWADPQWAAQGKGLGLCPSALLK